MDSKNRLIIIFLLLLVNSCSNTYDYKKMKIKFDEKIEISILDNSSFIIDSVSIYDVRRQYYILSRVGNGTSSLIINDAIKDYHVVDNIKDLKLARKVYFFARIMNIKNNKHQTFNCNFWTKKKRKVIVLRAQRERM